MTSFESEDTSPWGLDFDHEETLPGPCKLDKPYKLFTDGTSSADQYWEV